MTRKLKGVFYGWRVVAASFLVNAIADGIYFLGFTIFFLPISRDLHLSRTATSLPFALARIVGSVMGPIVGLLIDRLGAGKVLAAGATLGGLGLLLLRWTDNYGLFLLVFLGPLTVGILGSFSAATSTAVSQWFIKRRGLALAIAQSGYSIGGGVIPPLLALGVTTLGWRTTAMIAGLGVWATVLPLSTQLRRSPESMGLRPDGESPSKLNPPRASSDVRSLSTSEEMPLRQAFRTSTYWLMTLSFGLRSMVFGAVAIHLVAIMTWKGVGESTAGYLVGVYAIAWTPAILVMGWMGDRWSKQRIAAIGSFVATLGISLLILWDQVTVWQMMLVLVLLAPNEAGWALAWAMLGDFFGRRNFATLRGGMIAMQSLMAAASPIYAGWIYDRNQDYFWVVLPAVVLIALAGGVVWFLPNPRKTHRTLRQAPSG